MELYLHDQSSVLDNVGKCCQMWLKLAQTEKIWRYLEFTEYNHLQLGSKKRQGGSSPAEGKAHCSVIILGLLVNWQILLWLVTGNEGKTREATVTMQENAQAALAG